MSDKADDKDEDRPDEKATVTLPGTVEKIIPVWSKNSNGLRWHNLRFPRFSSNRFR
jgi:hypothetical protein